MRFSERKRLARYAGLFLLLNYHNYDNFLHMSFFEVTHQDGKARTGIMHTDHGDIHTPAFMPVGTQATVKTLDVADVHSIGSDVILNNTYHLHLRPGENRIANLGGVHNFQGWDKPILTDSGGFQVFSLGQKDGLVTIDDDGVTFKSHLDGSSHRFTPEEAIIIQQKLGADIIMAFDQCTADDAREEDARIAMDKTHVWAARCVEQMKTPGPHAWKQFLFGIIQGGYNKQLRLESADAITGMDFDGIAVGGESIGYYMDKTVEILGWLEGKLPVDKPRYTMGVGASPMDILAVVEQGIDMFDCVVSTRMARNGGVFVRDEGVDGKFRISLSKAPHVDDVRPMCSWCLCRYCKGTEVESPVTRAYLHHLFKSDELLGARIATYHNLFFMEQFMSQLRESIFSEQFIEFARGWRSL